MSTAPDIRKYAFDTEFAPDGKVLRQGQNGRLSPEQVEAERTAAFEKGKREAIVQAEREAAAALNELAKAANAVLSRLDSESATLRTDATRVAMAAARQIAGAALDSFGVERAAAAVEAAMDSLRHQPRLIVKLAPAAAEKLRERIEALGQAHAYQGAVIVRDDPAATPGRVAIDWSDGVISLDPNDIAQRIQTLIDDALSATAAGQ